MAQVNLSNSSLGFREAEHSDSPSGLSSMNLRQSADKTSSLNPEIREQRDM